MAELGRTRSIELGELRRRHREAPVEDSLPIRSPELVDALESIGRDAAHQHIETTNGVDDLSRFIDPGTHLSRVVEKFARAKQFHRDPVRRGVVLPAFFAPAKQKPPKTGDLAVRWEYITKVMFYAE